MLLGLDPADLATAGIAVAAIAGVIVRPWRVSEAVWAIAGATALVAVGLLPVGEAMRGVADGTDVYLFLTGMMLLAELARAEGVFDWLAAWAVRWADGSATRLFAAVYGVGTIVTVFLSNDATAVVLTPAVAAAMRAARAAAPLPYVLACAFVANAASFVLPISNPANLVVFGSHMPALGTWVARFAVASAGAIAATYMVLRLTQRGALRQEIARGMPTPTLGAGGRTAAAGIVGAALAMMAASARGVQLGWPTFGAGLVTVAVVLAWNRQAPWRMLGDISWSVLPLVAGLFVLVRALERIGLLTALAHGLAGLTSRSEAAASWGGATILAIVCNLTNNLPAGLIAGGVVRAAQAPIRVTSAALVGIDIGPNLSITGSLATILWLSALRREGIAVSGWAFLRVGALAMPAALLAALLLLPS
ncbi:MAG TPA: SLC13 family permease [Acetobacteraceae bacterium]|nr:SLC13 family permease [Acetobacteraceae bacterium]